MSDQPMIERAEVGKTKLKVNWGLQNPTVTPRNATEQNINVAVKDVIRKAWEQREINLTPTANAFVESADVTALSRLKNLVPEKARHALRLSTQKAALTASGLYLLISSGCGNVDNPSITPTNTPEPTPASASIPEVTDSIPLKSERNIVSDSEDVAKDFLFDRLKPEYNLSDGTRVTFDTEKNEQIRQRAILLQETEIVAIIPPDRDYLQWTPNRSDRPETLELPKDVLSKEELAKKGITIIQADKTNLYIREGAFAEGGPLANYNTGDKNLTIVLVNGPYASDRYMKDAKYDKVRRRFASEKGHAQVSKEELAEYKSGKIKHLEERLALFRDEIKRVRNSSNPEDKRTLSWYKYEIDEIKKELFLYKENVLSDEQFSAFYILNRFPEAAGLYSQGLTIERKGLKLSSKRDTVIFVAVGEFVMAKKILAFDRTGRKTSTTTPLFNTSYSPQPHAAQTHPRPTWFRFNTQASSDNPKSYPYAGQTSGQVLRHEIEHDRLIAQRRDKGEEENRSEYDTDMAAMETIREAWEKWEKSGFTDNSGYYFVFSLPEGGYILTENKSSSSPGVPAKS